MGWKEWPSWLKGGMVLVIIYIILILLSVFTLYYDFTTWTSEVMFWTYVAIVSPTEFLSLILPIKFPLGIGFLGGPSDSEMITSLIVLAIFYFFIGSIIGWIYGKIKNRNQSQLNQNI